MKTSQKKTDSAASLQTRERHQGKVIWFNASKGYGFLRPEEKTVNGGKDLFVHFHYIVQRGFKTLMQGDVVEFSVGENKSGPCAQDVKMIQAVDRPQTAPEGKKVIADAEL